MSLDQQYYSLVKRTFHLHDVDLELQNLQRFLSKNSVSVTSALDIACGDGDVTVEIQNILGLDTIWGNDINPYVLNNARRKNINTICADMNNLNIDSTFDITIIYGSLHHSYNKQQTIKELVRLSSKYILIVDLTVKDIPWHKFTNNRYYRFDATRHQIWTVGEICHELQGHGCAILDTVTFDNANFFHDRSFILASHRVETI